MKAIHNSRGVTEWGNSSRFLKCIATICFACATGFCAWADSVTLTSSSSGSLTITEALAAAGAAVSSLTGNVYDDIIVAGDGEIQFDTDISAYMGAIHVSSGATLVLTCNGGLGAASGKAYVADGGALIIDATGFAANKFRLSKAEIHIAGNGPDGRGALIGKADASQRSTNYSTHDGMWGDKIVLDGDALISTDVNNNNYVDFIQQYPASKTVANLDMNGHTLTVTPIGCMLPVRFVVDNPGHIVTTNNMFLSMGNANFLGGSSENTFTVSGQGRLTTFGMSVANEAPWTLVHDTTYPLQVEKNNRWDGPIRLEKAMGLNFYNGNTEDAELHLYGGIVGDKPLRAYSNKPADYPGHLYLHSASDNFTGTLTLDENTYLHVMNSGALPVDGSPIIMTNAMLDVQAASCVLPSVDCFCSKEVEFTSGPDSRGRVTGTFVKRGSGTLAYGLRMSIDSLDLKDGTMKLTNARTPWYAGVYEGDRSPGWTEGNPAGNTLYYGTTSLKDSTQLSLRWLMSASTFSNGGCSVYEGWFYCPASKVGKWRFASNVRGLGVLRVDSSIVISKQNLNKVTFGNATISEGWHSFQFRMGRTDKNGGPNVSVAEATEFNDSTTIEMSSDVKTAWVSKGAGLCICTDNVKATAKTTDPGDFEPFFSDPGDGSVLRIVKPGSAEEDDIYADFAAARTFGAITAATNTTLDLCGALLNVGCVTGFPTVVSTGTPWDEGTIPNLTVSENWTASAEGIASGAVFTVTDGSLTFREGATLTVPDSNLLRSTQSGGVVVATATGGIAGMPTLVFAEAGLRGKLFKSQDGKSLLVSVGSGLTVIVR